MSYTVIMILRVSVMFNQPKRIRLILSFLYSLVTVNSIAFSIVWEGPHSGLVGTYPEHPQWFCGNFVVSSVTPVPIIGGTFCNVQPGRSEIPTVYDGIPRGVFDILLLVLAIYRFAVNAIETRRMMGRQKVNKYMTLLLEHSIVYFFLYWRFLPEDLRAERSHQSLGTSRTKHSRWECCSPRPRRVNVIYVPWKRSNARVGSVFITRRAIREFSPIHDLPPPCA